MFYKKSPHGEVDAYWQDDILVIHPKGSFNMEGMQVGDALVRKMVEEAKNPRWARVDIFTDENVLGPLEALKNIINNMHFCKHNGCTITCAVGGNIIQKETISGVSNEVGLPAHFFPTLDDAIIFLRARGFVGL